MKNKLLFYVFFQVVITFSYIHNASGCNFFYKKFTQKEGLSNNLVYCSFKDSRGLIWLGTDGGLSLYQGDHFINYKHFQDSTTASIQDGTVFSISEDNYGNIWLGTYGNGVTVFNPLRNQYLNFSFKDLGYSETSSNVFFLKNDSIHHSMSILSDKRMIEIDYIAMRVIPPPPRLLKSDSFIDKTFFHDKVFYATFSGGILVEDSQHNVVSLQKSASKVLLPNLLGFSIIDDKVFLNSYNGVFEYRSNSLKQKILFLNGRNISSELINSIEKVNDSLYFIITNSFGVLTSRKLGDTLFCDELLKENQEIDNNVYSCMFDRQFKTLFIGAKSGLIVLKILPDYLNYVPTKEIPEVFFLHPINKDSILLGSETGLYFLSQQKLQKLPGSDSVDVTDIDIYNKDTLIVAGRDGVNFLINSKFYPVKSLENKLNNFMPYKVKRVNDEEILISSVLSTEILVWNISSGQCYFISKTNIDGYVTKIVPINGKVFICASSGIGIYENNKLKRVVGFSNCFCTNVGYWGGFYYVSTSNNGLYILNEKFEFIKRISVKNGLYEDELHSIYVERNCVWLIGKNSIGIYNFINGKYEFLVPDGDYPFTNFFYNAHLAQNGIIYSGGDNGILILSSSLYDYDKFRYSSYLIDEAVLNNERLSWVSRESKLHLSSKENNFYLKIISNNNYKPSLNNYQVSINGKLPFQLRNKEQVLQLNNLQPDNYDLEISNSFLNNSVNTKFVVHPPWYQSWWFRILVSLLILANAIWITRLYFNRRLMLQQKEIEKEYELKKERERISMDLHDDLGSGLSSIRLISEMLKNRHKDENTKSDLNEIVLQATTITSSMRELVWSLNSRNDSYVSFVDYAIQYGKQFFEPSQIKFDYTSNLVHKTGEMSAFKRRNLFLIYKELLNNIVKHSQAKKVHVFFKLNARMFELLILEDGIAFDSNNSKGNGLYTIQKRVDSINASYEVSMAKEITFKIKLAINLES